MMEKIIGNKVYKPVYQEAGDIYKFHEQKLLLDNNQYIPYSTWLQNNIDAHINFGLLQGLQNFTINSLR